MWQLNTTQYGVTQPQKTVRLKDGGHIINNWYNEWNKEPMDTANAPVQAVEVDKEGRLVWQLRAWKDPDLGPSTTIQLLSEPVNRDRMFFGEFNAQKPKLFVGPNEPMGQGRGIHPGRVAWVHAPGVAKWDGKTGLWVEDRWNDQALADRMIPEAVMQLTGEPTAKQAWQALFKHFNKTHGRGNRGYKKGESIAVKLNLNNAITHHDTIELNSSPFVTLALVRSMVRDAGVRQQDIVLCEPSRAITDSIYNKVHREFPQVRMVDNLGGDGREKCEYYPDQIVYSVDNGKMATGLAKCVVDADYLINSALLKTHSGPGVTLTTKNWYGATDINLIWRRNAHNNVSQDGHGRKGTAAAHRRHVRFTRRERGSQSQVDEGTLQRRLGLLAHSLAGRGSLRCRGDGHHHQRVAGVRQPELLRRVSARGGLDTQCPQRHGLQAAGQAAHRVTRTLRALEQ